MVRRCKLSQTFLYVVIMTFKAHLLNRQRTADYQLLRHNVTSVADSVYYRVEVLLECLRSSVVKCTYGSVERSQMTSPRYWDF